MQPRHATSRRLASHDNTSCRTLSTWLTSLVWASNSSFPCLAESPLVPDGLPPRDLFLAAFLDSSTKPCSLLSRTSINGRHNEMLFVEASLLFFTYRSSLLSFTYRSSQVLDAVSTRLIKQNICRLQVPRVAILCVSMSKKLFQVVLLHRLRRQETRSSSSGEVRKGLRMDNSIRFGTLW